jgi:hypothetical protein
MAIEFLLLISEYNLCASMEKTSGVSTPASSRAAFFFGLR